MNHDLFPLMFIVGYPLMVPITLYLGKLYSVYYVSLTYWGNRTEINAFILEAAYKPFSLNSKFNLYAFTPFFTVIWPVGIVIMIMGSVYITMKALYTRYMNYGLRPKWWSWHTLSKLINRGAK